MISKETNTIIKGIAVLMMLFLHLFNGQILDFYPELQELPYRPLCYLDGQPLEYIITRCCRPVPFFFILSGYGMSILYKKNRLSYLSQTKRLLRIFSAYWITLLIFVPIGHWLGYDNYPGSIWNLLENASSYSNSYNLSMWFLFPYTIICLISPFIINLTKQKKSYLAVFIITGILYGITGYIISRHIEHIGYHSVMGHLLMCIQYIFPFTCGVFIQKINIIAHPLWQKLIQNKTLPIIFLFIVILLKSLLDSQALDTLYALAFIILLTTIPIHRYISRILYIFGKYSMVMWMVHMYLSHYFFTSFIYGFRYPFLIFTVLLICSFSISFVITRINEKIHFLILRYDK